MAQKQSYLTLTIRMMLVGLVVGGLAALGIVAIAAQSGIDLTTLPSPDQAVLLLVLGLVALAGAGIFLVGLGLYVFLPARSYPDAVRTYATYPTIVGSLFLALGLGLALFTVLTLTLQPGFALGQDGVLPSVLVINVVSIEVALLIVTYVRIIRPAVITWSDMGLTPSDLPQRLLIGLLGGVGVLVTAGVAEEVASRLGAEHVQTDIFAVVGMASLPQFIGLLLAGAVLAAVVEETFFRGYVFTALLRERSVAHAYLVSAVLFAVVHLDFTRPNLIAAIPFFTIGLLLAFVYHRTQSVVPAIVAHGLNNLIGLSVVYFGLAPIPS